MITLRSLLPLLALPVCLASVALTGCSAASDSDSESSAQAVERGSDSTASSKVDAQLLGMLNKRGSSLRNAIIDAIGGSCDPQWCLSEAYGSLDIDAVAEQYEFKATDLVVTHVGTTESDNCPKSECVPQYDGADEYVAVLRTRGGFKWGGGDMATTFRVQRKFAKEGDDSAPVFQKELTLGAIMVEGAQIVANGPAAALGVDQARASIIDALNRRDSPLRNEILSQLEDGCDPQWCLSPNYGSYDIGVVAASHDFKASDLSLVRVGTSESDACPKQECTPQYSGSESFVAVLRTHAGFKWGGGDSAIVMSVAREFQKAGLDSDPIYTGVVRVAPLGEKP